MDNLKFLREQAERCFRLAQGTPDSATAAQLETFGRDYEQRADALEVARERAERRRRRPAG